MKLCTLRTSKADDEALRALRSADRRTRKLSAAFFTSKLWPAKSVIRVAFVERADGVPRTSVEEIRRTHEGKSMDPLQEVVGGMSVEAAIERIVRERFEPIVNLSFEFIADAKRAHVRISFKPSEGCWSELGTDCTRTLGTDKPTLNFAWFDVATTIHEFGHVLGMIHEHQNAAGHAIRWNESEVYKWAKQAQGWNRQTTYENIIEKYSQTLTNGGVYDPESIMLYFFPASLTTNGQGTRENLRLSVHDVLYLQSMYPGRDAQGFYRSVYGSALGPTLAPFDREKQEELYERDGRRDGLSGLDRAIFITVLIIVCSYVVVRFLIPRVG